MSGPRLGHRNLQNLPPPMDTINLHLYTELFPLKEIQILANPDTPHQRVRKYPHYPHQNI